MAQHPEKLKWREAHPYGLSASQFGMALGFCGRVSDYVHYLRDVVGTEQEFQGNAYTAHGINTEPKSRALYELLLGCCVHDGGFFVTDDRILGCSPDGRIYYKDDELPIEQQGPLSTSDGRSCRKSTSSDSIVGGDTGLMERRLGSGGCSFRVPFKSKRRPRSPYDTVSNRTSHSSGTLSCDSDDRASTTSGNTRRPTEKECDALLPKCPANSEQRLSSDVRSPRRRRRRAVRLLEIKSPFRALYDSKKNDYQCYGIPKHYMCQIQGQLAIADCEECDFFVYLDHPISQVEAWRVRRSRAFWAWAEPNLRCVSNWVKDGPPDWLNRSFAFTEFNFRSIEVVPLIFPFDITANAALTDTRRFAFFAQFENPFGARRRHGDSPSQLQAQEFSIDDAGSSWAVMTEYERIAATAQTPVTRRLFSSVRSDSDDTDTLETEIQLWGRLSSWRRALEMEGVFEKSATGVFWKAWTHTACAIRDPLVRVTLTVPTDWNAGQLVVQCSLPSLPHTQGDAMVPASDAALLSFHRRLFFASLLSDDAADPSERASPWISARSANVPPFATQVNRTPVFASSVASSSRHAKVAPTGTGGVRQYVEISSTCSSSKITATPSRRDGSSCTARASSVVCVSPRNLSTSEPRGIETNSQDLCGCHSPHQYPHLNQAEERVYRGNQSPDISYAVVDQCIAAPQHSVAPQREGISATEMAVPSVHLSEQWECLLCEISVQDLLNVIRLAHDCEGVVLVSHSEEPLRYYKRNRDVKNFAVSDAAGRAWGPAVSTLLVGERTMVQKLLHLSRKVPSRRPSMESLSQYIWDQVGSRAPSSATLVPCFVVSASDSFTDMHNRIECLGSTPCFVVRADTDAAMVLEETKALVQAWGRGVCSR
ncbi:hypothetical protein JKF63_02515 [Porcisia hertigi]|uniref:YqaJ viral recombinase domain-containing protein n=1 Tax=Porcisia hertigi TaxID=2761500 RepID=A0A836HNT8_9TRYP|nr:hypothetical protein JKF63_02515 [Porcisia hertigi]